MNYIFLIFSIRTLEKQKIKNMSISNWKSNTPYVQEKNDHEYTLVTYNVNFEWEDKAGKSFDFNARKKHIVNALAPYVNSKTIVCLQECMVKDLSEEE